MTALCFEGTPAPYTVQQSGMQLSLQGLDAYRAALHRGYAVLRGQDLIKEGVRIAVANRIGLALVATLLCALQFSQFSRLLLVYFYLLSTAGVVFWHKLTDVLYSTRSKKQITTKGLLTGGGATARQYYNDVVQKHKGKLQFVGYPDAW